MEKDEPFDPTDVRVLCVATEVASADCLAHAVKELGLGCAWRRRNGHGWLPALTYRFEFVVN
jgi:hypothetical protein